MEYEQPDAKRCWDDNGLLIGGIDYHIANGWKFRAEPNSICERYAQLIDPNGCALMDGFMMEPQAACESLNARPAERELVAEVERYRQALEYYAAWKHADPFKGPWNHESSDFGNVARTALGYEVETFPFAQQKQEDGK